MSAPKRRVTGLQRQVYSLYRRSLQMVQTKPIENRPAWFQFVGHQFRDKALGGGLRRKDVAGIEYLLRRGEKMLESYKGNAVTKVGLPDGLHHSKLGWIAKGGKKSIDRPTSSS